MEERGGEAAAVENLSERGFNALDKMQRCDGRDGEGKSMGFVKPRANEMTRLNGDKNAVP